MEKVEKGKKKLEVKKEKVRPLTDDELDDVAGAGTLAGYSGIVNPKGPGPGGASGSAGLSTGMNNLTNVVTHPTRSL